MAAGDQTLNSFLLAIPRDLHARAHSAAEASPAGRGPPVAQTSSAAGKWIGDAGDAVVSIGAPELAVYPDGALATSAPAGAAAIAAAWQSRGEAALDELVGPHAVALWDAARGRLLLQVDALNVESLYLRVTADTLYVCTEVAPLLELAPATTFDPAALVDIVGFRFLAGAQTMWTGVRQITPGYRCVVRRDGSVQEEPGPRFRYGAPNPSWQMENATSHLELVLQRNLERLRDEGVSDVAVQVSGGVDSSVLAALARRTFPRCTGVTFRVDGYANPELERAEDVARRLQLPLHVARVQSSDVARLYPWIIERLQEPPLHYNNPIVARMLEDTRDIAPVVIAGDVAGVYSLGLGLRQRLHRQRDYRRRTAWLPAPLRGLLATLLRTSGVPRLVRASSLLEFTMEQLITQLRRQTLLPDAAAVLPVQARSGLPSADLVERVYDRSLSLEDAAHAWVERVMEGPILRRNTRFAAALGVRVHYPLYDVAALGFVREVPRSLRFDEASGLNKPLLRALCERLVGGDVAVWSKLGLPSPEQEWMEGPLATYLADSLADGSLLSEFVDVRAARTLSLAQHQSTVWTLMTLHETLLQGYSRIRGATAPG